MNSVTKQSQFGQSIVTPETGYIVRQATGIVLVTMDDVDALVIMVGARSSAEGRDFSPLSVRYQEKIYAAGRIPGDFFKRGERPSEKGTLTSCLIDRSIRPLFPGGFMNEVWVVYTVVSTNEKSDPGIATVIGTSAAPTISGIPFASSIGAAYVGFRPGIGYILSPTYEQLQSSGLDMVTAGTENAVLMVESGIDELIEDQMPSAVLLAHDEFQAVIRAVKESAAETGKPAWDWKAPAENTMLVSVIKTELGETISRVYTITTKQDRYNRLGEPCNQAVAPFASEEEGKLPAPEVRDVFDPLEYRIAREDIINDKPHVNGRDTRTVRPLRIEVGVLGKIHGPALFTRGETQTLVVAILGTARDAQLLDILEGERKDVFALYYNFPPFSISKYDRMGSLGRREIDHDRLARRDIATMLPTQDEFPYTIHVVSEITESNGSNSTTSVCGASLALMGAGVPVKTPIAGIAMGPIKEGEKLAVLTDILDDEDHLGDIDFKAVDTDKGATAPQMDIKINGITEEIMEIAPGQALEARLSILDQMNQVIVKPRAELPENAPTMLQVRTDSDKIHGAIGESGMTIRGIREETKASISVGDDGSMKIYGETKEAVKAAKLHVLAITAEAEIGKIYVGKVEYIVDFGVFANILPGKGGPVHISQISDKCIDKVTDMLQEDQEAKVLVPDADSRGRIELSIKDVVAVEASGM